MKIFADLHVHSRHSRACSKELSIANLEKWARVKGISLLGTGDFSHPLWIEELKRELHEDGTGIPKTKTSFPFVFQNEISLMYTQGGKGRRVHLVILAPDFATVEKITAYLKSKGRVDYDGRPIFNISAMDFAGDMRRISDRIEIIPAHIWTPWFGILGSKTGFNSIEEAFGRNASQIHALETGLSSNPEMNRKLSQLDKYRLVSFSDLHSFWPWRIGREATIFDLEEMTYDSLLTALRTGKGLFGTIEVDPGYGKYHMDGHRACGVSFAPVQSKAHNNLCPVCKRPLTIGVLNRVEELADKEPQNVGFSYKLIPLSELIAFCLDSTPASKKTWAEYYKVLKTGKDELDILLNVSEDDLRRATEPDIAELIIKNREGKIDVIPGYDGEYGIMTCSGKRASLEKEDEREMTVKEEPISRKPAGDKKSVISKKHSIQPSLGDYF